MSTYIHRILYHIHRSLHIHHSHRIHHNLHLFDCQGRQKGREKESANWSNMRERVENLIYKDTHIPPFHIYDVHNRHIRLHRNNRSWGTSLFISTVWVFKTQIQISVRAILCNHIRQVVSKHKGLLTIVPPNIRSTAYIKPGHITRRNITVMVR